MLCLTSCGTYTKVRSYKLDADLRRSLPNMQFIGETEVTCEYDTYLGFIKHLVKVNGKEYVPGNYVKLNCKGLKGLNCKGLKTAAYDLLKKYPNAEYFQLVSLKKTSDKLFLGTTVKKTAKIRVYKYRDTPLMVPYCNECKH